MNPAVQIQPEGAVLRGEGLVKHYPPTRGGRPGQVVHALDGVDVSLYRGRTLGVVGESGSGKSTIARLLALLVPPTQGRIYLDGRPIRPDRAEEVRHYRSQVQMVFQDPFASLNPAKSVESILSRPLYVHRRARTPGEAYARLTELLEEVGLTPADDFLAKYPHELSGGQRQRVGIARALATGSRVLLADEPVSMLDVSIRAGILNLLARLRDENGLALMYITHDLASARYLSDQIMVMYAAQPVEFAAAEELVKEPLHPYSQLLLASVPDPDAPPAGEVPTGAVRGEPPNMMDPPSGCRFHPRCPLAMAVCREEPPPVRTAPSGRWVRCHLYGEGAQPLGERPSVSG